MGISISTLLKYYKRPEIQQAIVNAADDKEVAVKFGDKGFGKRPDILSYPRDVLVLAQKGATSLHCSEELWNNPLSLVPGVKKQELDENRKGWDLILDIDCPELEFSKIAANLIVQGLRHEGVNSISIKFSGNNGFHIGVPFEALPTEVNGIPIKDWFPEGPRKIAAYLTDKVGPFLRNALLGKFSLDEIVKRSKTSFNNIAPNNVFDPFEILKIDTVLISSRHLYRMPYSLHEKSGLASVPIRQEDILSFDRLMARPEVVVPELGFLEKKNTVPGEARKLIVKAFDFTMQEVIRSDSKDAAKVLGKREFEPFEGKVSEEFFPPCIKLMSQGMTDGKKRAMFMLTNFLQSVGWNPDEIEEYLTEWNKRNPEPLREVLIVGHMRALRQHKKKVLPPNCANKAYYIDIGVCKPDGFCPKIKNPANYAIVKNRIAVENKPPKRKKTPDPQ